MKILLCFVIPLLLCAIATLYVNFLFMDQARPDKVAPDVEATPKPNDGKRVDHNVAGLSCKDHGGPSGDAVSEMVYWSDIPADSEYVSPYANYGPETKYLTVEPDEGFWNNKRMSMEAVIALAVSTGRVLVIPPKQSIDFKEIFPFEQIAKETPLQVMSMEEFLTKEGLTGNLRDKDGKVQYPPENKRVNWEGDMRLWWDNNPLWPYLRSVATIVDWEKDRCVAVIPDQPGPDGVKRVQDYLKNIQEERMHEKIRIESYTGNPTPVDAPPQARLRELLSTRKELCVYNEEMQNTKFLHTTGDGQSGTRILAHFYALLFYEDWRQDLFVKRFIRDHFRYVDELQCAAGRIVREMRQHARRNGDPNGAFDTFHVRRGDFLTFQRGSQVNSEQIYKNTQSVLVENSTVYIATDEGDKSFFDPLRKHYKLYFLADFAPVLSGIELSKFGMIDQLVASRGRTFVGLYYSTFTGYINRMRAYHSQKEKQPGYKDGAVRSYFYAERRFKYDLRQYRSLSWPTWKTEFPTAWRDIDHDVLDLDIVS